MQLSITSVEFRYMEFLRRIHEISSPYIHKWLDDKKWGMDNHPKQLQELMLLQVYLSLLEWKAYWQNRHFLQYDDNNCPKFVYPSMLPEAELLLRCEVPHSNPCCGCTKHVEHQEGKGIIDNFYCLNIHILPALEAIGVYPLGNVPDGISYMVVETPPTVCSNDSFQVDKPRQIL